MSEGGEEEYRTKDALAPCSQAGKRNEGTGAGSVCGKVLLRDSHSLLMQSSVLFGNLMQSIVPSRLLARSSKHDWPNNVWLKLARVA